MDNFFKAKIIKPQKEDLEKIGFDKSYINNGIKKHQYLTIKVDNLNCAQANIIKQTAISVGTDCAVHKEVITGKIDISSCIITGSISHFEKIIDKLKHQPFKLKNLSEEINQILNQKLQNTKIRDKEFDWNNNTYIMGILNITPDSFSDGGEYTDIKKAIVHYEKMVEQGADIIDIGGESTRPNATTIKQEEECQRIIPIIEAIRKFDTKTVISIDTRNALTANLAIKAGADIINDISGLEHDKDMQKLVISKQLPIIVTHSSNITDKQNKITDEIFDFFQNKIDILISNGLEKNKIIIDPGLGFNKTFEDNLEIIKNIKEFKSLNNPILIGHSRKSFIQTAINSTNNDDLDIATALLSERLSLEGANILRVHNIKNHKYLTDTNNLFR